MDEFLTGSGALLEPDRVLATVLFTDIVGSTERAAELGDAAWRDLLARITRSSARAGALPRRGVDTAGDGFFAASTGPAGRSAARGDPRRPERARARDSRGTAHRRVRARRREVGGIAVPIGARVASLAGPGEVLVSATVKDLVAGSGIEFEDRGAHELKGIPGEWRLFAVR